MGIYVFSTRFLYEQLRRDAADPHSSHDFGRDIIPYLVAARHGAWRTGSPSPASSQGASPRTTGATSGTLDAYFEANWTSRDVVPALDLYDRQWPIWTMPRCCRRPSSSTTTRAGAAWR